MRHRGGVDAVVWTTALIGSVGLATPAASAQRSPRGAERAAPSAESPAVTTPPRVTRLVEAVYPPEALHRGESAIVRLEIDVDASGHVTNVAVAESSGNARFDEAAVVAAREFEFAPARRDGQAVPARIRYRYRFAAPVARATDQDSPRPEASPTSTNTVTGATVNTGRGSPPRETTGPENAAAATGAPSPTAAPARTEPAASAPPMEQGVTVYARAPSREIGRREVTAEEVRRIPGARGDALLALQNLPGVARPPFGIGQFIVRSSAPEDSLITLEGQPIVLPFHFGGFSSTIATDLIERIEFLPGNFSTRYGRVAGGVINITMRAPQRDRVHSVVDVDPIDAGIFASAPLGRNASIAIGGRRSFIDLVGPLVFGGSGGTSFRQWPFFADYQVVLDWDPTPRDSIRIVAAGNDDQLILNFRDPNANDPNVRGDLGTHLAFHGVQARWRHRFGPNAVHTFAPAVGYNLSAASLGPEVRFTFQSVVINLRDELELHIAQHARVFAGIDAQYIFLDNDVRAPPLTQSGITDPIDTSTVVSYKDRRSFPNPGAYLEAEIDASPAVRLLAGVRLDYFGLLDPALSRPSINPRSSIRIALGRRAAFRAGLGLYSTPPRGYFVVPGFGNPNLHPETWLHIGYGINLEIIPGVLDFDTDVFVKLGDQVVAPSARVLADGTPERYRNTGFGRVIGGEWMLRMRPGRLAPIYGMISYTYQHATRAACDGCPWVTYQYDQPHIFSGVLGVILPYGLEAGIRARFTSGTIEPTVTGALLDTDRDISLTITDPSNPGRLPSYFSLDWRVSKRFQLGPIRGQVILEVLNTTNNANVESRIYSYDRRTSQYVTGVPIIPSLGIRAEY